MKDLEPLIKQLSRLPGLGPRSAKRAVLQLLKKPQSQMIPLADELRKMAEAIETCTICGNLDTQTPCSICQSPKRDGSIICVVEDVDDLWALERTHSYKGLYHILGGTLSALDGIRPEDLNITQLINRVTGDQNPVEEIILALPATVDGQTTAHYIAEQLQEHGGEHIDMLTVSHLAHGVPVGGELDYLDDGTLTMALERRRAI